MLAGWAAKQQTWVGALAPLGIASEHCLMLAAPLPLMTPLPADPARSGYATSEDGEPYWLVKNIWSPFWVGGWVGGWMGTLGALTHPHPRPDEQQGMSVCVSVCVPCSALDATPCPPPAPACRVRRATCE